MSRDCIMFRDVLVSNLMLGTLSFRKVMNSSNSSWVNCHMTNISSINLFKSRSTFMEFHKSFMKFHNYIAFMEFHNSLCAQLQKNNEDTPSL